MSRDKFTSQSWRSKGDRPGEGLSPKPGVDVDPAGCHPARIMDVADHPGNVKYVDETIVAKQTKKAVTTRRRWLPGIGGVQVVTDDEGPRELRDGTASSPGSRTMQP